jgi:hypothetical protein
MAETMALFARWGVEEVALFTFPHSVKHVSLYQKYDFWPQHLIAVMQRQIDAVSGENAWTGLAGAAGGPRVDGINACRTLAETVHPGLDLTSEIDAVLDQKLGDAVMVHEGRMLAGFGICHVGAGTEAGSGVGFIKFAAARPGPTAPARLTRVMAACAAAARERGAERLIAGVNTGRHAAYKTLIGLGFETMMQGVAMQKDNRIGTARTDCFVIDDWR